MKRTLYIALQIALFAVLTGCSQVLAPLKAGPADRTGVIVVAEKLVHQKPSESPFQGSWVADEVTRDFSAWPRIYVAPVNTKFVENHSLWHGDNRKAAVKMQQEVDRFAEEMREQFRARLGEGPEAPFHSVDTPVEDALILELAIVELTPTDVVRSAAGLVLSAFVPGGGLLAAWSQGAVAIEGVLRDGRTGRELFMFADRERGKLAPINLNDFTYFSHAHDIIDDWADQLAQICRSPREAKVRDSLPVTLFPI